MTCPNSPDAALTLALGLGPIWSDCRLTEWRDGRHYELASRLFEALDGPSVANFPRNPDGSLSKKAWGKLREAGAIGVSVPEHLGGGGYGLVGTAIVSEAAHQTLDCGLASAFRIQNEIASHWLTSVKSEYIAEHFAIPVVSGRAIASVCRTEADHLWQSSAERIGGDVVINARKALVVNFINSDVTIVSAKMEGAVVAFALDSQAPGITVVEKHRRWGASLVDQVDVAFDEVRVPIDCLLTSSSLHSTLSWNRIMCRARLTLAMDSLALMTLLIVESMRLLRGRSVYVAGIATPLGQIATHQIAVSRAIADAIRIRSWIIDLVLAISQRRFAVQSAACLRWFAVDRALSFARYCFELRGGRAYLADDIFHRLYSQVAGLAMSGGSQEAMLSIVASGFNQQASSGRS